MANEQPDTETPIDLSPNDNLLIQSYLTVAFLIELTKLRFLESTSYRDLQFEDQTVKKLLPTVGLDNRGALLVCLYAMLIIPKQLLENKFPREFKGLNVILKGLQSAESSTYASDATGIEYVRHIRNAVAHARVTFIEGCVTFLDENAKSERCEITIPLVKMPSFLTELQSIFLKYVTEAKRGFRS
jgi:hypothetical protein